MTVVDRNDVRAGFNDYSLTVKTSTKTLKSSYGARPIITAKLPDAGTRLATLSRFNRGSAARSNTGAFSRAMIAIRGAGYTSASRQTFNLLNINSEKEESPEEKIKQAERRIMILVEESAKAACEKDMKVALEKAQEACLRERDLVRFEEQINLSKDHDTDVTFAVILNLAVQYSNNELYAEAISTYQAITKNKNYPNSARLKVNIGNIYVKMGKLTEAIRMYHMALDNTKKTQKYLRIKILHNIGILYVRMGRWQEAADNFEWSMIEKPDLKAGMHAILCHFALKNKDKMKRGFSKLLKVPLNDHHDDKSSTDMDDIAANIFSDTVMNDNLSKLERELKLNAEKTILNAANLIAPVIEDTHARGFKWCVKSIRSSAYSSLAFKLEINKAAVFIDDREERKATEPLKVNEEVSTPTEPLKVVENQDTKINSYASTVLSFIRFLGHIMFLMLICATILVSRCCLFVFNYLRVLSSLCNLCPISKRKVKSNFS